MSTTGIWVRRGLFGQLGLVVLLLVVAIAGQFNACKLVAEVLQALQTLPK